MKKVERKGKVFVDWSQNHQRKTTIAVYSLRARERPTVSTPVEWDEIERAARARRPGSLVFETDDVLKRVERRGPVRAGARAETEAARRSEASRGRRQPSGWRRTGRRVALTSSRRRTGVV